MQPTEAPVGPINEALRLLGLTATAGKDEFQMAGLDRWRDFDDLFTKYETVRD
jgi:hypothetical protein